MTATDKKITALAAATVLAGTDIIPIVQGIGGSPVTKYVPLSTLSSYLASADLPGTVTLAEMANLAANSIIGNNTGISGVPIALTVTQTRSLLGLGTGDRPTFAGAALVGAADVITLSVTPNGTQTNPVVKVLTQTGGKDFQIDQHGNITSNSEDDAASTRYVSLTKTYTAATVSLGGGVERHVITYTPGSATGATQIAALYILLSKTGTRTLNDPSAYMVAVQGESRTASDATSGTVTRMVGVSGISNNTGAAGTVTYSISMLASMGASASAIITNQYGLVISPTAVGLGIVTTNASATITNAYGIYVEDITVGTNKYAIYTVGTNPVHLSGSLQVGTHATFGSSLIGTSVPTDFVVSIQENLLPGIGQDKGSFVVTATANADYAAGGALFAGEFESVFTPATGTAFQVVGVSGGAFIETGSGGTITGAFGVKAFVRIKGTGIVTTGYGLMAQLLADTSGATFTDGRSIGVLSPQLAAGTAITTVYGLKIENMTGTGITTAYAIHTGSGLVHFGGAVDMASTLAVTGAITGSNLSGTNTGDAYTLDVLTPSSSSPAASTTYFWGSVAGAAFVNTTGGQARVYFPKAGTVTAVYWFWRVNGTLSSNQTFTLKFRLNDTTDTNLSTTETLDAANIGHNATGLSIAVAAGDYMEFKAATPAWGTLPTNARFSAVIYVS